MRKAGDTCYTLYIHAAIDDIFDVTDYLLDLGKNDIYNLGLTLGLNHPHLAKMRDFETFTDDMIAAWLHKEDQVIKQGVPTWETLVKALRHPRVNQNGVAEKIATEKLDELTGKNQQQLKLCNPFDNN